MKKYSIPIIWSSYTRIEVEAENMQEALNKAFEQFFSTPDPYYLEDSAQLDDIIYEEHPSEMKNIDWTKVNY